MKIVVKNQKYDVRFNTGKREDQYQRVLHPLIDTFCKISTVEKSETGKNYYNEISLGVARQSHKDKYNKYLGFKLAFSRAVAHFDREDRKIFWEVFKEYFKNHYDFPATGKVIKQERIQSTIS